MAKALHKLNQVFATAVCGNDIMSSALYVSGIAVLFAGVYAPLVFILISAVLYLYRKVYQEVVEALPVNGGAYNCLLNATSKTLASVAGIMTILSYVATAVISAKVGVEYLHWVLPFVSVIPATLLLLFLFAVLIVSGVKDSANVALGIFIIHSVTLIFFVLIGIMYIFTGQTQFSANIQATQAIVQANGGLVTALFLAFSASLLGISGFESSANFVEEQKPGVFRKTLRNMWMGVSVFNPLIAIVILHVLPISAIAQSKDFVLSDAAFGMGGSLFAYLVVVDAFLVLSGAVLTSYVGVTGLIHRMTIDGCLPAVLLKNRHGNTRIVFSFFLLCSSILLITHGSLLSLAGVYTISFLGVMSLFAFGNLVLRETRKELKRPYKASLITVILAFLATTTGIVGNMIIDPKNLYYFGLYFVPAILLVLAMLHLESIYKFLLKLLAPFPGIHGRLHKHAADIVHGRYVLFIHNINRLYGALSYINRNEQGVDITIVHCKDDACPDKLHDKNFTHIKELIPKLQEAGVFPHFKIKLQYKNEPFGPKAVAEVSKDLKIAPNRIFVGSIHHFHEFDYQDLGGVRIISG